MLRLGNGPAAALAGPTWRRAARAALAGLALGVALGAATAKAATPDAVVIGDSIGVGVSMASGLTRLAKNSVAIRGGSILNQLREAPPGSTVFMSLGTNDAVGRIDGLDADIARIIAAAGNVKLVWIGPPCVSKGWDTNAQKLDGLLKEKTAGTKVVYVPMRDAAMCDSHVRAKDGVHFTMAGYGLMWNKAREMAGYSGGTQQKTMVASAKPGKASTRRRVARRKRSTTLASAPARAATQQTASARSNQPAQRRGAPTASASPAQ